MGLTYVQNKLNQTNSILKHILAKLVGNGSLIFLHVLQLVLRRTYPLGMLYINML